MLIKKNAPNNKTSDKLVVWRIINIVVTGVMLGCFGLSFYFIYVYIYQTIGTTDAIVALNASANQQIINIGDFNQAEKQMKLKKSLIATPYNLRNIFAFSHTVILPNSTSTPTSTKKLP